MRYNSGFDCFKKIIRTEGVSGCSGLDVATLNYIACVINLKVRGLYKGVLSPVVMQGVINAIVFGVEGPTSRFLMKRVTDGPLKETIIGLSAGMTAGFAQTVICAPMELVKLRVQHQAIGEATRYQGNWATLMEAYRRGGVRGCYQGFWITAFRDTPAFGVYFATYETLMHFTAKTKSTHKNDLSKGFAFIWGGCAGMASWLLNYPVDLVKTRMQLDGAFGTERQYHTSWGCFKTIWKEGGVKSLYRGLSPCLLRAFANSAVLFVAYESMMQLLFHDKK